VKVTPHEAIGPVHRVKAALDDARERVERPPRLQTIALKLARRHVRGGEGNMVVSIAIVQPPRLVEQASLGLEAAIKRRAGEWGEVIEGGDVHRVLPREGDGPLERIRCVPIIAEDKGAVDADAVTAEVGQGTFKSAAGR